MRCPFAVSIQFLYASWSHVVTTVVTAPLERVVYILQIQNDNPRISRTTDTDKKGEDRIAPYSGNVIPNLLRLAKEQGIQSWWHGNGIRILHLTLDQFLSQYVWDSRSSGAFPLQQAQNFVSTILWMVRTKMLSTFGCICEPTRLLVRSFLCLAFFLGRMTYL